MRPVLHKARCGVGVAERWKKQYFFPNRTPQWSVVESSGVYAQLLALGPTPDPDAVDRIIGNSSWTSAPSCDACEASGVDVVTVGQKPDYESSTADLCRACVAEAIAAFEAP